MPTRAQILAVSQGLPGTIWAIVIVWIGASMASGTQGIEAIAIAMLLTGAPVALMILNVAFRRFFTKELLMGEQPEFDSPAGIDIRVLRNTVEQAVLTLCVIPAAALFVSPDLAIILGANFVVARIVYWIGYRISHLARIMGFAMGFYALLFAGALAGFNFFI